MANKAMPHECAPKLLKGRVHSRAHQRVFNTGAWLQKGMWRKRPCVGRAWMKRGRARGENEVSFVAALAGLLAVAMTYDKWQARLLRRFCHALPVRAVADAVIASARKQQFVVEDMRHTYAAVFVSNKQAPFFRYTCRISVANGVLASSVFVSFD